MASPEPVAIIGIGCRLPGDSDTPDEFWQMLAEERSGFSRPPLSRWNTDGFHSKKTRPGSLTPEGGYFINEDVWNFDPSFFGIVQEEAKVMDPQQRKLLECVYESFESGGITLSQLSGSNTGCYVGNFTSDFNIQAHRDHNNFKPYSMLGTGSTIISNRVSYLFDLCGPSLTIDTACSSSLYSLHIACRALQTKEINAAVVGGTNLMLAVDTQMSTASVGVLSATSTCHTFDESADGYGRGEGVGAIFLKRLSDAIRDKDPIRGVIRGTATNANGKTSGITQPSAKGHEALMRTVYEFAGLDPKDTSYFEAHGTGTQVGDPIEVRAIGNFFFEGAERQELLIGSVKTNVGHSEAASALASIIKVCLAIEKRTIPATIGIKKLNPKVDFKDGRIKVVQKMTPWPKGFSKCRASVNSFGYGGANAHAIIEAADSVLPGKLTHIRRGQRNSYAGDDDEESDEMVGTSLRSQTRVVPRSEFLLLFSAHDISTLKRNIERFRDVAEDYNILDLAYTLGCRRSDFFNCAYAVAREEDVEEDLMEHEITFAKRGKGGKIAFIFTGQGAQNAQMGRELMLTFPSYIDTIRRLDRALQCLGEDSPDWTIENVLMEPAATSRINDVEISQPVCTAVQIALVELLRAWDVIPAACIGHSSGEIASAYAANLLTAEEAIISAFYRGLGVATLEVKGSMLAVGAGPEEIQPYLVEGLRIACYNSPNSVTLSGDIEPATIVKEKLQTDRLFVRELKTGGRAYHSHHMLNIGNDYQTRLSVALSNFGASQNTNQPEGQNPIFFSSVTAERASSSFKPGPSYWRKNLESPVRFTEAVEAALAADLGISQFVEIGPHSALAGPLRQIRDSLGITPKDLDYASTLVRGQSSVTRLLDLAGVLTMRGYSVNIERVNAIEKRDGDAIITKTGLPIVDLPRYSWNYSAGELRDKNRPNEEHRLRKFKFHDLLGALLPGSSIEQRQWRNMLDSKNFPWLEEHKLGLQPVLPGTGYLAIATEAARQFFHDNLRIKGPFRYFFPSVSITSALNVPNSGSQVEIVTTMKFATISASIRSKTIAEFTISSVQNGNWTNHCVGTVTKKEATDMAPGLDESKLQEPKAARTWYRGFQKVSLNYGPAFNGLSDIRTNPALEEAVAETELLPAGVSEHDSAYIVHPTAMDTCIQAAMIAAHKGSFKGLKRSFVPTSMADVSLWSWRDDDNIAQLTPGKGKILAHSEFFSVRALSGWCQLFSPEGKPLFEIKELLCTQYSEALDDLGTIDRHPYLRTVWKPDVDKITSDLTDDSLLDIIVHKRPGFDICEIWSTESTISENLHKILESGSSLRRYKTYTIMTPNDVDIQPLKTKYEAFPGVIIQKLDLENNSEKLFNLVILPPSHTDEVDFFKLKSLLTSDGKILLYRSGDSSENIIGPDFESGGFFTLLQDQKSLLMSPHQKASLGPATEDIVLVTRTSPTTFDSQVYSGLLKTGRSVISKSLQDSSFHANPEASYVFIVESESSLFHESLTSQELAKIQSIASEARNILWLTHGNLLDGGDPDAGIVIGLGRCLQTEHPTLTFKTLDLDHRDPAQTISNITTILDAAVGGDEDKEFMVKNNAFYVSRLSQDQSLDEQFVARLESEPSMIPYDSEKCVRLGIERVGIFDTIHFQDDKWEAPLNSGEVEIDVKAVGLNMKDYATLVGSYNSDLLGFEGAGVIRKIGPGVRNVAVGDRVSWAGPGKFRNIERYDSRFVQKLQPKETFEQMSSIMVPFVTAIYGLIHLAKLQPGESVLIHSATGGVGLAAIQIAKMVGAEIFATVGTPEKKGFLMQEYGLHDDHILSSKDASFASDIMRITNGRGVDVSLNSLVHEQLRATWNSIGHHGRHIEVGQTDILDQGMLDMGPFKRGASFIAMDLVLAFEQKPDVMSQFLSDVIQYYRDGKIQLLPNTSVFPASEISQAFKQFAMKNRIGRVVVSFDTEKINFVAKRKSMTFKPNGAYLLVGCLGGLGRCLARHMVENGARHLIFLGRSGEDRREAASMIKYFRDNGIAVDIVKGDVTNLSDVEKAVGFAAGPILGVVQGVMALDDRLFTNHDLKSWEYAVRPKVTGTWNLHNAVAAHSLDFFVMLGSTAALSGFPTQSNYCAGNSFLEFFARYRQSKGLPATTISLTVVTEVGFVSQNERIEDGLARNGVHNINEAGVIDLIETAIMKAPPSSWNFDPLANNFIVSGLEPLQLSANLDIDGIPFWRQPRIGPVLNAILAKKSGDESGSGKGKRRLLLPDILELVVEKFSQTFNLAVEDVDTGTAVVKFGMDSMIGTSLRTWCYKTLGADITSSEFMSLDLTAESLAQRIYDVRKAA
ncbi:f397abe9-75d8-410a-8065-48fb1933f1d7 [Sclerotinia trifoliorum]|uniref:F397abe9-75d8-410a-8065-48fb1933f1d7 n=1 Tax=Sclerotinia trifoliorum TaxID=28548 RepID=A0A8H2W2M4_9HELO|nr:f397abe9-75d8-410a-8065-48fb1933f1d7 [Sclerotinia trifoliorum]